MMITKQKLDQVFNEYNKKYGGLKGDYFGLLYLSKEFNTPIDDIAHQVAFGGNDYGIDAFHIDINRKNLYLYQFKWSENHRLFKDTFERLISAGMERIFGNPKQDNEQNQLLLQLKSSLLQNQSIIDRVFIHFVFNGDANAADRSAVLDNLQEELSSKKYLIDQFFGRKVSLSFQYMSNQTKRLAGVSHITKTHTYKIDFEKKIETSTPNGEKIYVGFIKLIDLYYMFQEMGQRFFERNIRAGLSADKPPNRAIRRALANIVIQEQEIPEEFVFNHNGVTMAAESLEFDREIVKITEPRILNGAQTISSLTKFMKDNESNPMLKKNEHILHSIKVIAKILCSASKPFIVNVTICNNRQNPVKPWNLRANDDIQLALQDKFKDELEPGIYYERQEDAFENLTDLELEEMGIEQDKKLEIKRLAQTFLAVQGEIDRMSRLPDVFENEKTYKNTFKESYLKSDVRRILLGYKIQFRLNRIIQEIIEKGYNKYYYIGRARNLVWALLIQGILNDKSVTYLCEQYGTRHIMEVDFSEFLKDIASRRIRAIISDAVDDKRYQQQISNEKYSFLRTKAMYQHCMYIAYKRFDWEKKSF